MHLHDKPSFLNFQKLIKTFKLIDDNIISNFTHSQKSLVPLITRLCIISSLIVNHWFAFMTFFKYQILIDVPLLSMNFFFVQELKSCLHQNS